MRTVGVERECFIIRHGCIVPLIGKLLPKLKVEALKAGLPSATFTYELFAGQVEDRTLPCRSFKELEEALKLNQRLLRRVGKRQGLEFAYWDYVLADDLEIGFGNKIPLWLIGMMY